MNRIILNEMIDLLIDSLERELIFNYDEFEYYCKISNKYNEAGYQIHRYTPNLSAQSIDSKLKAFSIEHGLNLMEVLEVLERCFELFYKFNENLEADLKLKDTELSDEIKGHISKTILDLENLLFYLNEEQEIVKQELNSKQNKPTSIVANPILTDKLIKPIWWTSSDRLLGYLIEQLEKNKLINIEGNINKVIKEHFINKQKKPFTDSIKQNRSGATKPKDHNSIDEIVNKIKAKKG